MRLPRGPTIPFHLCDTLDPIGTEDAIGPCYRADESMPCMERLCMSRSKVLE